jgi:hypothetical protein
VHRVDEGEEEDEEYHGLGALVGEPDWGREHEALDALAGGLELGKLTSMVVS